MPVPIEVGYFDKRRKWKAEVSLKVDSKVQMHQRAMKIILRQLHIANTHLDYLTNLLTCKATMIDMLDQSTG